MTDQHEQPDQDEQYEQETPVVDPIEDAQRRLAEADAANARIAVLTARINR